MGKEKRVAGMSSENNCLSLVGALRFRHLHSLAQGDRMTRLLLSTALITALTTAGPTLAQSDRDTMQYDDGRVYEGTFKDGQPHGQGTLRTPTGYEYSGTCVDGEIRGDGVARFPNGSVYEGSFAAGKPHGFGQITFADGSSYDGD